MGRLFRIGLGLGLGIQASKFISYVASSLLLNVMEEFEEKINGEDTFGEAPETEE